VESSDGILSLEVRHPKELGGAEEGFTNPEQLFAAGWAACFNSALSLVARRHKLDAEDAEVRVTVTIGRDTDGATFKLGARLDVKLSNMSQQQADTLVEQAHQICPYSKATRGNIEVELHAHVK
jgi:Ohr subfamily peroxiredoxin